MDTQEKAYRAKTALGEFALVEMNRGNNKTASAAHNMINALSDEQLACVFNAFTAEMVHI